MRQFGGALTGLLLLQCGGEVAGASAAQGGGGASATRGSGGASAAEGSAGHSATGTDGGSVAALGGTGGSEPGQQPPGGGGNWVVSSDGPCAIPPACGGDPVGSWELVASCGDPGMGEVYASICSGALATHWLWRWLLFSAAGDWSTDGGGVLDVWWPASCARGQCEDLASSPEGECVTGTDGSCSCREYPVSEGLLQGTYTVEETQLVWHSEDSEIQESATFCVNGSTMTMLYEGTGSLRVFELRRLQ
jgi:hypothetical protein